MSRTFQEVMAGRNPNTTNELLARMTQVLEVLAQDRGAEPVEYRGLSAFTRHHPPKFEGKFNPEGARQWISEVEKVFVAMGCLEEHKVTYATYLLVGEAENWWKFTAPTLPRVGGYVEWEIFKGSFLGNYFPGDLRKQKAREFLELKQGSMTVGEYAAKFQELAQYWPHFQHVDGGEDLCAQFESGLRPEIRTTVSILQLNDLPTLISKCRIYEASVKGKMVDTRVGGPARTDRRPTPSFRRPYQRPLQTQASDVSFNSNTSGRSGSQGTR